MYLRLYASAKRPVCRRRHPDRGDLTPLCQLNNVVGLGS